MSKALAPALRSVFRPADKTDPSFDSTLIHLSPRIHEYVKSCESDAGSDSKSSACAPIGVRVAEIELVEPEVGGVLDAPQHG